MVFLTRKKNHVVFQVFLPANASQDYSICFLPKDHSILPRCRLSAADRALARSNHADEAEGELGSVGLFFCVFFF